MNTAYFQNHLRVAQASSLWFRASRPKPAGRPQLPSCLASPRSPRLPTKSGATPDLTGVTPVPPILKTRPGHHGFVIRH
jgi:hypothetical protein